MTTLTQSSSGAFSATLAAFLNGLPLDTNKFNATASLLTQATAAQVKTPLYRIFLRITIGFTGLLTLNSFALLAVRRPFSASNWVTTDHALLRPNASNFFALFSFLWSIICVAELAYQITLETTRDPKDYQYLIMIAPTRFIPCWLSGWAFAWATAAATLTTRRAMPSLGEGGAPMSIKRKTVEAWALNTFGVVGAVGCVASVITLSVFAGAHYADTYKISDGVIANLVAAAPTYDATTFTASTVIPYLLPLSTALARANSFYSAYSNIWITWITFTALLTFFFTPFAYFHARLLTKMGALRRSGCGSENQCRSGGVFGWLRGLNEYQYLLITVVTLYIAMIMELAIACWALIATRASFVGVSAAQFNLIVLSCGQLGYTTISNTVVFVMHIQAARSNPTTSHTNKTDSTGTNLTSRSWFRSRRSERETVRLSKILVTMESTESVEVGEEDVGFGRGGWRSRMEKSTRGGEKCKVDMEKEDEKEDEKRGSDSDGEGYDLGTQVWMAR